jgi:hypothetical protein
LVKREGNWQGPPGERIVEKMNRFEPKRGNANSTSREIRRRFVEKP